ncbi:MAG: hypothetical protein PHO07_17560 [Pirellulales bacterium]|nr:hypothetical protein [Pirellulales bacterium]
MTKYEVSLIEFPSGWQPASPDDVPPSPARPTGVLAQTDDLFRAVRKAIEHNEATSEETERRWAVVVEPGCCGRIWSGARLCTPLRYKVATIWWPTGWEPNSPLDVPNCVWRTQGEPNDELMPYSRALATVQALNHQGMNVASSQWFVVIAVENEPISHTVSLDPSGTETTVKVRRVHLVRPERGGGGDCGHCPAHSSECATALRSGDASKAVEVSPRPIDMGG